MPCVLSIKIAIFPGAPRHLYGLAPDVLAVHLLHGPGIITGVGKGHKPVAFVMPSLFIFNNTAVA